MDENIIGEIDAIVRALRVLRLPAVPGEYDIHALVEDVLLQTGFELKHEARISPGCRIDFLCGDIGIEVKKGKPAPAALKKQLEKYAASGRVRALLIIAPGDLRMPRSVGGVPVVCVALSRMWGVALP